ncbi:MAG: hypothetical protein ACREYC_01715 [Gammaproteobacteria bacterium]
MTQGRGKKLTFSWSSGDSGTRSSGEETVRVLPARRWTFYLLVLPTVAAVALLAIFFFAVFLAFSVVVAVALGLWFWWARWKLGKLASAKTLDGEYVVIEETQTIENKKDNRD